MTRPSDQGELIESVATKNDVSADLVVELLKLEKEFNNLHEYGARSRFRARIGEIIDAALRH